MTVVVGYVPDPTGYLAVTEAVREATWRRTDVIVINAVDQAGYVRPTAADELDLDALGDRLTSDGVPHEIRHVDIGTGQASDAILAAVEQADADLVVVGMHRRSPVGKAFLGSNAQRVLLDAPCPVLAVRATAG
ncbi:universal stress protein [Jatrophihabitans sp.]|jgi:nucleotide-binding universal stress UspA family protein|uniref:universal stress protein n=1 Tax=Jatrophihabitans sp. TaxID=1932789 RepID=UPI002F117D40